MKTFACRQKQIKLIRRELNKTRIVFSSVRSLIVRSTLKKVKENLKLVSEIFDEYEREIKMLKSNNRNLALAIQNERERSKVLLQDKIAAESSYHNLLKDHVIIKEDLRNVKRVIINFDEELKNSMIPNLVKLSDDVTKFKLKSNVLRLKYENEGNTDGLFPKSSGYGNINFGTNSNQPVSTVNPMIKGCIIQKPTINVQRVSFPHESRTSLFANVNISSPIVERSEEENVETINNKNRKCKNGLRHMINLSNRQVSRNIVESNPVTDINYCDNSEPTDNNLNLRIEPVIGLCDVTQLLHNSSHRNSVIENKIPSKENFSPPFRNHCSPEILLTRIVTSKNPTYENHIENPLEGCSWMYQGSLTNDCDYGIQHPPSHKCLTNPHFHKKCKSPITDKTDQNQIHNRSLSSVEPENSFYVDSLIEEKKIREEDNKNQFIHKLESTENVLTSKTGNRASATTFSSSLDGSALRQMKKFFSVPLENSDVFDSTSNTNNNNSNLDIINDATKDNEVECVSTSTDTISSSEINLEVPSLLLQNCTTRQKRGRVSTKRSHRKLSKSDKYSRESCHILLENICAEPTERVSLRKTEVNDAHLIRSKRLGRKCKRNFLENGDSIYVIDYKLEEPVHKKQKNKVRKKSVNTDFPLTIRKSATQSKVSIDKKSTERKSRTSVNDILHRIEMNEQNMSCNETISDNEENNRTMTRSGRNKKISYKEPTLRLKLRREK